MQFLTKHFDQQGQNQFRGFFIITGVGVVTFPRFSQFYAFLILISIAFMSINFSLVCNFRLFSPIPFIACFYTFPFQNFGSSN